MRYAFVINNRTCIGCHACSTACKQENRVPLGVHRTWVKVVEKGQFPTAGRSFQVTRCNHCANPPCVRICPVTAMFQRPDGVVDFDPEVCIGCKACLQACPYDAIHMDPDSGTAAKCHFCAHRLEVGLEPACVHVCPEQAIVAGDVDDPTSAISQLLAREKVTVRRPEQGTVPHVFYINGDEVSLRPTAAGHPGTFAAADVVEDRDTSRPNPLYSQGRIARGMVQTVLNAQHKVPWHWPVPAYMVTKAVAAGIPLVMPFIAPMVAAAPLATAAGAGSAGLQFVWAGRPIAMLVALLCSGLTAIFLIADLDRPKRFLLILTRPQWRSWLTRGAFILLALAAWQTAALGLALLDPLAGASGSGGYAIFAAAGMALGVAGAAYTAFLLGQAEGRDLWQSPFLPVQLVIQAAAAGAAALLIIATVVEATLAAGYRLATAPEFVAACAELFTLAALASLAALIVADFLTPPGTDNAAAGHRAMVAGAYRRHFWSGGVVIGHVVPLFLLLVAQPVIGFPLYVSAAVLYLIGLYAYETAFIMAPQRVPNA